MRSVPPDVAANDAAEGRVLLLILDDTQRANAMTVARDPEDQNRFSVSGVGLRRVTASELRDAVTRTARAIVDRLGPADRASVIFTVKNERGQEFTRDRGRLLAAIDAFDPVPMHQFNDMKALDAYAVAARRLSEISNRRKAVILISHAAPSPFPSASSAEANPSPSGLPQSGAGCRMSSSLAAPASSQGVRAPTAGAFRLDLRLFGRPGGSAAMGAPGQRCLLPRQSARVRRIRCRGGRALRFAGRS
jgi:hypothetical protein